MSGTVDALDAPTAAGKPGMVGVAATSGAGGVTDEVERSASVDAVGTGEAAALARAGAKPGTAWLAEKLGAGDGARGGATPAAPEAAEKVGTGDAPRGGAMPAAAASAEKVGAGAGTRGGAAPAAAESTGIAKAAARRAVTGTVCATALPELAAMAAIGFLAPPATALESDRIAPTSLPPGVAVAAVPAGSMDGSAGLAGERSAASSIGLGMVSHAMVGRIISACEARSAFAAVAGASSDAVVCGGSLSALAGAAAPPPSATSRNSANSGMSLPAGTMRANAGAPSRTGAPAGIGNTVLAAACGLKIIVMR